MVDNSPDNMETKNDKKGHIDKRHESHPPLSC